MTNPRTLPDSWHWADWKSVARVASNLVDPLAHQSLPHIAPNHIQAGTGRLLPYRTVAEDEVTSSKHLFLPGQILYSKIRPYLAKAVLVEFSGLCSADMYPVETSLEPRYLKWWMLSPEFTRLAAGEQARTVLPKINKHALGQLPVPVPPLDEQRRIVDLLEGHLSHLDAAENYLKSGLRRAKLWHQRMLANTLWSPNYPLAKVGDLLREPMRNGRSDRSAAGGEVGTRSLTLTAVTKNAFTEANTKVTVTAPDRARDLWLEPGDVFVQRSNTPALVGTAARYDGPREWAIFPDLLIRLRANEDKIDSRFLAAALQSKPGHDQLRRKAKGLAGSMPKIDQSAIASTMISVSG